MGSLWLTICYSITMFNNTHIHDQLIIMIWDTTLKWISATQWKHNHQTKLNIRIKQLQIKKQWIVMIASVLCELLKPKLCSILKESTISRLSFLIYLCCTYMIVSFLCRAINFSEKVILIILVWPLYRVCWFLFSSV